MQDMGKKDGSNDGKAGLYAHSFYGHLKNGKVKGRLENGKVVEGADTDLVDLPDVVSQQTTARARSLLQKLDPPIDLSEELTVKQVVMKLMEFQAALLHLDANDEIDALDDVKLARVGSAHGTRAKK